MAETFKFIYIMILCVSLFTVEVVGQVRCKTDEDCDCVKVLTPPGLTCMCDGGECGFFRATWVVVKGGEVAQIECVTKEDCYKKLPDLRRIKMICVAGFCKYIIP
ncbi:unnamed protein product [Trifolium pratense]|uniref:Uncharacterized protein n=1 Tax=Trifolium pratense TaxID=57577 RepID=A0ACB0LQ61_TRIPR|nr:unnamed protein product [Trifolium pratense]